MVKKCAVMGEGAAREAEMECFVREWMVVVVAVAVSGVGRFCWKGTRDKE